MAAPLLPLQPVKLAPGPSSRTPEQTYWKTFISPLQIASPSSNPVTHISHPLPPSNTLSQVSDHFAVTSGTRVQIFSTRTRKLVKTIARFNDVAHGAEIRRDGRVMVAGDDTGAIQVFDVHSRAILKTWDQHKQSVWTTKFSPTESTSVMSASDDRTVRLWDLPSEDSLTTFVGHQDYVRTAEFMPGQASGLLVSGSYDETVRLWDPRTPSNAIMTFKHTAPVEAVLPLPSGTSVLAAAGNQISVLDIVAAKPVHMIKNHQKTVTSLSLASHSTRLVSGGLDGHVKIFETTGWNVVARSKYASPILSLRIITSGAQQEDRHLAVGLQSGVLSVKTRLSGPQKIKERARQKEMQALLTGNTAEFDRKRRLQEKRELRGRGWEKRFRGQDFTGEGADIVIEGRPSKKRNFKPKMWETLLRKGKYAAALDEVLSDVNQMPDSGRNAGHIRDDNFNRRSSKEKKQFNLTTTVTLLTALRHRSALRTALSGRDELTLQPILKWVCTHITDPRYVPLCVDIGTCLLDLYAADMGQSAAVNGLRTRLHQVVKREVEKGERACQTEGMLGMVIAGATATAGSLEDVG